MAFVNEIQFKSNGFPGAPGFSNFYFATDMVSNRDAQFSATRAFWDYCRHAFPTGWTGSVQAAGRVLEENTGALGVFAPAPVGSTNPVLGDSGSNFGSGVSGAVVSWLTAEAGPNRLIRGRTFLVPLAATAYASDGTILPGVVDLIQTGANALVASATGFGVWRRPKLGTGGNHAVAVAARVSTRAVFLSSRRS